MNTTEKILGAAIGVGIVYALRQHVKSSSENITEISYDDCKSPNVWCYKGPDNEGNWHDEERCCGIEACPGSGGYEERP